MRSQESIQGRNVVRLNIERSLEGVQRFIERTACMETVSSFTKSRGRLAPHSLCQVTFGQLQTNMGILGIEICDLRQYFQSRLRSSSLRVRVRYYQIVGARLNHQLLLRIKLGKAGRDFDIVRMQAIYLPEHRDRLEAEFL